MVRKERFDKLLVEKGMVQTRERARALIMAGKVAVEGKRIDKPGTKINIEAQLQLQGGESPYVSRGGEKLEGALTSFGIDPKGMVVMDVGASTGGFTDCVLQKGAQKVYAVDVGYGQLAWKLQKDSRVMNLERRNIRYLQREEVGKGGVVRDKALHEKVIDRISKSSRGLGLKVLGISESPLLGPKGNKEFFIYLKKENEKDGQTEGTPTG
jgi:23S rRNA (cytidine1920-2'-O)/16S rRNA (cytidine1409-2'-O)-methyltransferase